LLTALLQVDPHNSYILLTDSREAAEEISRLTDVRLVATSAATIDAASAHGRRRLRDMAAMSRALSDPAFDAIVFPTVYSFVPVASRARKLVLIHDLIAERYPRLVLHSRRARWLWGMKVALGRRQADVLATVSEYSRQGLIEAFGLDPARVHVVGEASDPVFRILPNPEPTATLTAKGFARDRRTIVHVGGFTPHKNLAALLETFGRLSVDPAFADLDLLLVGEYARETFFSEHARLRRRVEELGLSERVRFTGFLPDQDLVVLLNLATVLVLPSLAEGFGLPAVEAAACGCPVVATKASPLPALLGEGALFIDPTRPKELDQALRRVLQTDALRARMREAGTRAAAALTWTAAARQLAALIEKACACGDA
jgi:glycosyltransferase involved in cell wall biosynthesis